MLDCEMLVVALNTLGGSLLASAGLIVSSALRTVTAASAESTFTRRAPLARKIWSWARSAKSWIASVTGAVASAAATASVTIGRAADTKFEVRASRKRRLVGDVVAHLLALGGLGDDVTEAVGAQHPAW